MLFHGGEEPGKIFFGSPLIYQPCRGGVSIRVEAARSCGAGARCVFAVPGPGARFPIWRPHLGVACVLHVWCYDRPVEHAVVLALWCLCGSWGSNTERRICRGPPGRCTKKRGKQFEVPWRRGPWQNIFWWGISIPAAPRWGNHAGRTLFVCGAGARCVFHTV